MGKSGLLAELARLAMQRDISVLSGRAFESEQILPFGPWIDALRAGGLARHPALPTAIDPVWRSALARLLPELGEAPIGPIEPRQLFEALSALLEAVVITRPLLGLAYAMSGRLPDGVAMLQRAAAHAEAIGFAYGRALVIGMLGEAQLLAGDIDEAVQQADEAVTLARTHGQRGWEAWALRLQAEAALARGALQEADARFADAITPAGERGMRPLVAHSRLGLGSVHARRGDADAARAETGTALAQYRAMEMPYWIARAEIVLRDIG